MIAKNVDNCLERARGALAKAPLAGALGVSQVQTRVDANIYTITLTIEVVVLSRARVFQGKRFVVKEAVSRAECETGTDSDFLDWLVHNMLDQLIYTVGAYVVTGQTLQPGER